MSKFFSVVGKGDFIKIIDEKIPIWKLLDKKPDGWFCSVIYKRNDIPKNRPTIWDCGAWTYRAMDKPMIGKTEVNAENIFKIYKQFARPGNHIIAPDHIILEGLGNIEERRKFNFREAERFLEIAKNSKYIPMASVQGKTRQERMDNAQYYIDLGYKAIALGGLAAQSRSTNIVIDSVSAIRVEFPDIYIHVLGLSAPRYAQVWNHIGIDSFDGSSHFMSAFRNGTFYMTDGMEMKEYKAARLGEEITAPFCNCKACIVVREIGLDTRSYGCNQRNMGRAAHNLNQLIKAIDASKEIELSDNRKKLLW